MTLNLTSAALLCAVHFMADFPLQLHTWATRKHCSFEALVAHVCTYTAVLTFFAGCWDSRPDLCVMWGLGNGVAHLIVDFITSRLSQHYSNQGRQRARFMVLGADQLVHHLCLLLSWCWVGLR